VLCFLCSSCVLFSCLGRDACIYFRVIHCGDECVCVRCLAGVFVMPLSVYYERPWQNTFFGKLILTLLLNEFQCLQKPFDGSSSQPLNFNQQNFTHTKKNIYIAPSCMFSIKMVFSFEILTKNILLLPHLPFQYFIHVVIDLFMDNLFI
jgi:hypothetical protein